MNFKKLRNYGSASKQQLLWVFCFMWLRVDFCCSSSLVILFAVRLVSGTDVADISWRRSCHYNNYHWWVEWFDFFCVYCLCERGYVFALFFVVVSFVCRSELLLIKLGRIFNIKYVIKFFIRSRPGHKKWSNFSGICIWDCFKALFNIVKRDSRVSKKRTTICIADTVNKCRICRRHSCFIYLL